MIQLPSKHFVSVFMLSHCSENEESLAIVCVCATDFCNGPAKQVSSQIVSEEEKYPSTFLPKQIFWIIATTPELTLNTKMCKCVQVRWIKVNIIIFQKPNGAAARKYISLATTILPPICLLFQREAHLLHVT